MYTLGIHGGVNTFNNFFATTPQGWLHDAAAVLCKDGTIVAASEEERFVRIKHVNYFPILAIRHCLESEGISLAQVTSIVLTSYHMDKVLTEVNRLKVGLKTWLTDSSFIKFAAATLDREFNADTLSRISFAGHHHSHALSAAYLSGSSDSLCVVLDGLGDGHTGLISSFSNGKLELLQRLKQSGPASLYLAGTQLLGYDLFDEYKIMGLAPYGRLGVFDDAFAKAVVLRPNGGFEINPLHLKDVRHEIKMPNSREAGFTQDQCDFALGLQRASEALLLHLLAHLKETTGHENLCLAGGFAQNCSANGAVLTSGLFNQVFVQPVAYDAGCALGAAVHGFLEAGGTIRSFRMKHLFWGSRTPQENELLPLLQMFAELLEINKPLDLLEEVANLLENGKVVAWVQGRAEFGARALGNRSILADPRPALNRQRINDMIKKRESFRPFAPSVMEEYLHEYFEVPNQVQNLPFMAFVVKVREKYRDILGAITHVDGSARVQSVSKEDNETYWKLIDTFFRKTGVPMLLNTSFNNEHEPIVDTPRDAINCLLSTTLDYLVVGNYLIRRRDVGLVEESVLSVVPQLAMRYNLCAVALESDRLEFRIHDRYRDLYRSISSEAYHSLLTAIDERLNLGSVIRRQTSEISTGLVNELFRLWCERVFFAIRAYKCLPPRNHIECLG